MPPKQRNLLLESTKEFANSFTAPGRSPPDFKQNSQSGSVIKQSILLIINIFTDVSMIDSVFTNLHRPIVLHDLASDFESLTATTTPFVCIKGSEEHRHTIPVKIPNLKCYDELIFSSI
uniref:(northern house mosquito) hypothetical protein n=1 Tax=Culex pipiens TaxID=7175 RepID=A0A8D8P8N9_CULPI